MEQLDTMEKATNILKNVAEIGVAITIIITFIRTIKKQWLGSLAPLQLEYTIWIDMSKIIPKQLRMVLPWFLMVSIFSSLHSLIAADYTDMAAIDYVLVITSTLALGTSLVASYLLWRYWDE